MSYLRKLHEVSKTCVLVNKKLCRKLCSSLQPSAKFDESFKVTSVSFFITDNNLLSCNLEDLIFKVSN